MDVKEAVRVARECFADVLKDEHIVDVKLEEVNFEECPNVWKITIGFLRPKELEGYADAKPIERLRARSYKAVYIDDDSGRVESIADWVPWVFS